MLLGVPIVVLIVMSNLGNALAPELVDRHPLLLLALNSQNRNLILTTNQLDAWSYYLVGSARLLVADPFFFLIGYWYGDVAIEWLERRTKTFGEVVRQWEGWFSKAAYPLLFVAPNNPICVFAGASGMSVTAFFVVNLSGTLARLYLIRWLGEEFEAPIDDVLGFVADYRTPLLVASVVLAVVLMGSELRGSRRTVEELEELAEEHEHPADGGSSVDGGPGS